MSLDTGNSLITLAELKQYIGMSTTTSTYDTKLTDIINSASHRFNTETGRKLKSRANTEYYDGDESQTLLLNEWPVTSVSTNIDIRIDETRSFSTGDKVDSTSIVIYSTMGKIYLDDESFTAGSHTVKVVYTAGYSSANTPHDLKYACKEYCRVIWNRELRNRVGVRSESVQGGSITYENDMPWSVKTILQKYKRGME